MSEKRQIEKILYDGALGISDPAVRRAFLEQTCRGDSALLERLEDLLGVRDAADEFFSIQNPVMKGGAPAPDESGGAESVETLGTLIGRYRLLHRLGEGGCGVVYLAEQEEPVRRRVALKIVRLGMDTADVIARFELERQALALMDHPNIARVLDAGATTTGRPFFVMEVVDGEKITDFCNQGRLGVHRRLELFIQVCQAIQHAHQKGVIHRDIKPSNVLVRIHDGVPVPKVIDFGIAKATAPRTDGDVSFTARDQFIGTPAYMSPEQAEGSGIDVDTRSDIYSLGVLLYELLTGEPPFNSRRLREAGVDELRRILGEEEPRKPSDRVTTSDAAATRDSDPQRLHQLLRGDLDWIVLKALEKDRQRRYGTVNGLAMDVLRYLNDEPVLARPPSRRYRLRKLMHRNKVVFVAGAVVLATLVGGLGVSTWLFFREKEALAEQSRLRVDAESARANEVALRRRAETREVIARAAVQLKYGDDIQQVDNLLAEIPVSLVSPSLESAATFRTLGEWHVRAGRWKEAGQRYTSVSYAISAVDESDSDNVSRDVLPAAAAICESGDLEAYEQFQKRIIHRFSGTSNPIVAEQVIKASLLLPADLESMAALDLLGKVIVNSLDAGSGKDGGPYMAAWRAFSLALLEYRRGDFPAAVEWGGRCLDYPNENPARSASVRIVRAMARLQLHRSVEANGDIAEARRIIQDHYSSKPDWGTDTAGFWFDWINARVLLREVEGMVVPME